MEKKKERKKEREHRREAGWRRRCCRRRRRFHRYRSISWVFAINPLLLIFSSKSYPEPSRPTLCILPSPTFTTPGSLSYVASSTNVCPCCCESTRTKGDPKRVGYLYSYMISTYTGIHRRALRNWTILLLLPVFYRRDEEIKKSRESSMKEYKATWAKRTRRTPPTSFLLNPEE